MDGAGPPAASDSELVFPDGVQLEGADFSRRRLRFISVGPASRFVHCDFRGIRATDGGLGAVPVSSEYLECLFDGSFLSGLSPGNARFIGCSFRDVKFRNLRCHLTEFVDCVFSGKLRTVFFNGRVAEPDRVLGRTRNEFHGNDFREADMRDVSFRTGIDLRQQLLPDGPDYFIVWDAERVLARAADAVQQWPPGRHRDAAEIWLSVRISECQRGQRDLFVRKSEISSYPEVAERVAELLEEAQAHQGEDQQ